MRKRRLVNAIEYLFLLVKIIQSRSMRIAFCTFHLSLRSYSPAYACVQNIQLNLPYYFAIF